MVDPAEEAEQVERVDAAAVGDAVLAVGREDVVLGAQRAPGADLGGLLAEELGPDAELAVALERGGLGVDPPGEHHVAVEAAQLLGAEVEVELGVVHPFALGSQQLDQLGAAVGLRGAEDLDEVRTEIGHQHSLCPGECGVSASRGMQRADWPQGWRGRETRWSKHPVTRATGLTGKGSGRGLATTNRVATECPVCQPEKRVTTRSTSARSAARPARWWESWDSVRWST